MQTQLSHSGNAKGASPHRVLVIDDDASMRLLAVSALAGRGFVACEADSGEAGLRLLAAQRFDAVILDLRMPGMEGFDVCAALRGIPGCAELPVIVVSGRHDEGGIERAYAAGVTDYLYKPVNWTQFIHKLQLLLAAREDRRDLAFARHERDALVSAIPDTLLRFDAAGDLAEWTQGSECPVVLARAIHALALNMAGPGGPQGDALMADLRALAHRGGEHQFELREGNRCYWFQARATACTAGAGIIVIRDITAQRRDAEQMEQLALRDAETGLGNRHWIGKRTALFGRAATAGEKRLVVYRAAIDNATEWLELFGPARFEELIRQLAQRLLILGRARGYVAPDAPPAGMELGRSGSGEFTLLQVTSLDSDARVAFAAQLSDALSRPLWHSGIEVSARVRVGMAETGAGADCDNDVFQQAGIAMLQARDGARRVKCYETNQRHDRIASIDLESRLRRGLQNNELFLHYQPQFSALDGSLTGFEALARWRSGGRVISPAEFIPVAEASGLIVDLGEFVLETACRQIAAWRAEGLDVPGVAVNLSAMQLTGSDFPARVRQLLEKHDVPPACLEIEITESLLLEDSALVVRALKDIRACGVKLALDDFGTGYASLGYLHKYELDVVKIDRSFVCGLPSTNRSESIVRAIVAMARALCMEVVAEGVETAEQLTFLEDVGCDFVQGFLTGRPQPVEDATRLLAEQRARAA